MSNWDKKDKKFKIEFDKEHETCTVDRRNSGVNAHDKFPGIYEGKVDFNKELISLKMILDVSQIEIFVNDGELVMTNLVFPEKDYEIGIYSKNGTILIDSCTIYELSQCI